LQYATIIARKFLIPSLHPVLLMHGFATVPGRNAEIQHGIFIQDKSKI